MVFHTKVLAMTTFEVVFGSDITFLPDRNTWDFWTSDSILLYHMYVALPDLGPHSPASECRHASSMRPKLDGWSKHGGPPGWLEGVTQQGVNLYVIDGPCCLPWRNTPTCPGLVRIWDVYPGSEFFPSLILEPHQRIFKCFNPKNCF